MGLMDKLRNAEEQSRNAARRTVQRASDAQRRIRQKMRIYPRAQAAAPSEVSQGQPSPVRTGVEQFDSVRRLEANPRAPIVSIRGEDVGGTSKPADNLTPDSKRPAPTLPFTEGRQRSA